jgi:hypothetical protein
VARGLGVLLEAEGRIYVDGQLTAGDAVADRRDISGGNKGTVSPRPLVIRRQDRDTVPEERLLGTGPHLHDLSHPSAPSGAGSCGRTP